MRKDTITKKFKKEVLDRGAEACLPVNLSDYWIRAIDADLNVRVAGRDSEGLNFDGSISLAAVVALINAKNGGGSLFPAILNEILSKLTEYQNEIALEIFRRRANISSEPATLNSIFTNRSIGCLKI